MLTTDGQGVGISELRISTEPYLRCPKCSATSDHAGSGSVTITIGPNQGAYCLACYARWITENVPKMEPI